MDQKSGLPLRFCRAETVTFVLSINETAQPSGVNLVPLFLHPSYSFSCWSSSSLSEASSWTSVKYKHWASHSVAKCPSTDLSQHIAHSSNRLRWSIDSLLQVSSHLFASFIICSLRHPNCPLDRKYCSLSGVFPTHSQDFRLFHQQTDMYISMFWFYQLQELCFQILHEKCNIAFNI